MNATTNPPPVPVLQWRGCLSGSVFTLRCVVHWLTDHIFRESSDPLHAREQERPLEHPPSQAGTMPRRPCLAPSRARAAALLLLWLRAAACSAAYACPDRAGPDKMVGDPVRPLHCAMGGTSRLCVFVCVFVFVCVCVCHCR